jgi:hypothetical protein
LRIFAISSAMSASPFDSDTTDRTTKKEEG